MALLLLLGVVVAFLGVAPLPPAAVLFLGRLIEAMGVRLGSEASELLL